MPKNRIILLIGLFLGLQPLFFGFPKGWEDFFQVVGGFGIVLLSVLIAVDKRLSQKAKAERRMARRREKVEEKARQLSAEMGGQQNGEEVEH